MNERLKVVDRSSGKVPVSDDASSANVICFYSPKLTNVNECVMCQAPIRVEWTQRRP